MEFRKMLFSLAALAVVSTLLPTNTSALQTVTSSNETVNINADSLHQAISGGSIENVKSLLAQKAPINAVDKNGNSSLIIAIENGNEDIVKLLIESGADINQRGRWGTIPILEASWHGNLSMIRLLIDNGVNLNAVNNAGLPAIHSAVLGRNPEVSIPELVKAGQSVHVRNEKTGTPPIIKAVINEKLRALKVLIELGANINDRNMKWKTPLHYSMPANYHRNPKVLLSITKLLIEHGADVNLTDREENTPLFYAAEYGEPELIHTLIEAGANVNLKNKSQSTPLLTFLSTSNDYKSFQLLVNAGADIHAKDQQGRNALHHQALSGSVSFEDRQDFKKINQYLIKNGIDINSQDIDGNTPPFTGSGE
ncbi:ankyrin repeat domain-containing protein [Pseudoalteromonas pernae]|uniref:ankyrin repeat domain-containing protein n=1 Tax=Pseudoalteromonas pernae TaxID=3118054 RepID=UPI0032421618